MFRLLPEIKNRVFKFLLGKNQRVFKFLQDMNKCVFKLLPDTIHPTVDKQPINPSDNGQDAQLAFPIPAGYASKLV